jgi:molybdopterin-guanine dinucleotide biosynthesis protein A
MGTNKALVEVDGVPMAARVAAALRSAGCDPVVAYGGDADELAPLGMPVLHDRYPGTGPLGGLLGVLELFGRDGAAMDGVPGDGVVLVAACDLAMLTGEALRPLVEVARKRPDVDVVVARTARPEPACAVWRLTALPRVLATFDEGQRALHAAIDRLRSVAVDVDAAALGNINTPEDLDRYSWPRDSCGDLGSGPGGTGCIGTDHRRT